MSAGQPMHPKASVPIQPGAIRANLDEILKINEKQEKQLQQYQEILGELRAENKKMAKDLKVLEPFIDIAKDPLKYLTCYIRSSIIVERLRARAIEVYGAAGNSAAINDERRKNANRLVDHIVEESVRMGCFQRWPELKRTLVDQQKQVRPSII